MGELLAARLNLGHAARGGPGPEPKAEALATASASPIQFGLESNHGPQKSDITNDQEICERDRDYPRPAVVRYSILASRVPVRRGNSDQALAASHL